MDTDEFPHPTHADLRSRSHASTRSAKQSQKYYAFRSGPMSRIGQPILCIPDSIISHPFDFIRAPLLTHPETVHVRIWTKRDQFDERTWDIWPLDRKDHKFGRRRRGRGCNYVPARWELERSMKERRRLVDGDELDMEEEGAEDAALALSEGRFADEYDAGTKAVDITTSPAEDRHCASDADYDMLSDLSSEGDESEWEAVILP